MTKGSNPVMTSSLFRKLLLTSMACFCTAAAAYAQDTTSAGTIQRAWKTSFSVETGFTSFALTDAHSLFDRILTTYRQEDIPLPAQTMFPGNMLIGGSLMFSAAAPFSFGIGGYYSRTAAISSYRDFSGSLLERMDVNLVILYMSVRFSPFKYFRAFYVCAHPGVGYSELNYTESVDINYPTVQSSSNELAGHGFFIVGDAGLGLSVTIFGFPAAVEADYRQGKVSQLTDTEGYIQVPLDISGFVFKARIGLGL